MNEFNVGDKIYQNSRMRSPTRVIKNIIHFPNEVIVIFEYMENEVNFITDKDFECWDIDPLQKPF